MHDQSNPNRASRPRSTRSICRPSLLVPGPRPLASGPSLFPRAFTLIELMVVMAIMAILAAAMAIAVSGAQESAQIAKTRSLIARLNALVMQKYESYATRRLPVTIPSEVIDPSGSLVQMPSAVSRKVRCDVLRQMMRMEMPDRWRDIIDDAVPIKMEDVTSPTRPAYTDPTTNSQTIQMQRSASSQAYLASHNSVQNTPAFIKLGANYQGAKCLYLLVTMGLEEPSVLENFSEGDIADFDHSGCKVFIDAWGNPINFLRWAPGLVSPLQPPTPTSAATKDQRMPDQTDPTGVYGTPRFDSSAVNGIPRTEPPAPAVTNWDTFALYPLVYSAGPDGHYDIVPDMTNASGSVLQYSRTSPPNNPFASIDQLTTNKFPDGPIGAPAIFPKTDRGSRALGSFDNIHSHSMGAR